ncbi:YhgE/Pip domain-containing protein [Yinghuangia seranimata]|uniref:YhgE/Pip domain-containing protein n=1 Tax=Yinghuangia seranimata TaxID=408067 RepID=UPI00248AEB31|nr:YhgE/Pip family protein [Yinghuangia seranimata]MDI2127291.1 YhgE/Pip family protein [Yinghuangia seranimata]
MNALRLAWLELRRFRGPIPRLVPIVIALVPLLYGALYLWSNWDPYGKLNRVPVAIVNEDRAVQADGQTVDAGAQLTARILADHTFQWHAADASQAADGLKDGDYYFVVTVPPDFSAALASAGGPQPRQADLTMTLNDANGFIVGKMAESAKVQLQASVSQAVQATFVQQAYGRLAALKQNLGQAAAGARQLQTGIGTAPVPELQQGAQQLAAGLDQLTAAVPVPPSQQAAQAEAGVLAAPVQIAVQNLHPAKVYGRGLAPFFLSIAMWVFGLIAFMMLRPLNTRALAGRSGALTVALAGWLPAAFLSIVGAYVLYGVVDLGLGLDPVDVGKTLLLLAVAAASFVAIEHFLTVAFGVIGDALSLVLLMLQLTSCGGLYPVETTPAMFRALHPVLPMSYVVEGLRVTISGGQSWVLDRAFLVLGAFLVVALALSTLTVTRRRMWSMTTLKPAIQV